MLASPTNTPPHRHQHTGANLMLRSILTNLPLPHLPLCRSTALIDLRRYRAPSMAYVLQILTPFDHLVPASDSALYKGLLRKCHSKDASIGSSIHCRLIKSGFGDTILFMNSLLYVYAKVGFLAGAVQVFDEMPERDLISWCTLISGFVDHGLDLQAYGLFKRLMGDDLKPNCFVVSSVLKGCSASGVLNLGLPVHGYVVKRGLGFDRFVEIGLVDMYAKCRSLDVALKVFYEIPVKCTVAWNAMISGYVQMECYDEAVGLFQEMCRVGVGMDLVTLRVVASAGSALAWLNFCRNLHVYSIKVGFDSDSFVVAELVRVLSKVGDVDCMGKLFNKVKKPDASLYSLLIAGYHLHGRRVEAVKYAGKLLYSDLNLKEGALVTVLNLCLCREEGIQIHARVCKTGHGSYLSVSNALISMYVSFEETVDAEAIFMTMPVCDIISWTTIMVGLVQELQFGEALENFHALRETGIPLDQHSVATTVNACTGLQAILTGKQIHGLALKLGFAFSDFLNASLLNMYAKCGFIETASMLFSHVDLHDLVLVNVMLAGYCRNSEPDKALELFGIEYREGLVPDNFTYSTVLSACADTRSLEVGEQIHCRILKSGFEYSDLIIGNAIVNMYAKSGSIISACRFFYSTGKRNVNTYAMLMLGYIQNRGSSKAIQLFYQMQQRGLRANPIAFARILRGCAILSEIDLGKQIHASIIKMGLVSDVYVGNALVGMYARETCRQSENIENIEETTVKVDMPCQPAIAGFSQPANEDRTLKAFGLFKLEDEQGHSSYYAGSRLCAAVYSEGQERFIDPCVAQSDVCLDASVVRSGIMLNKMPLSEVVLWNSTISEYIERGWENMEWFKATRKEEMKPEYIIYLAVFPAGSYADILDETISSSKPVRLPLFTETGREVCLHG